MQREYLKSQYRGWLSLNASGGRFMASQSLTKARHQQEFFFGLVVSASLFCLWFGRPCHCISPFLASSKNSLRYRSLPSSLPPSSRDSRLPFSWSQLPTSDSASPSNRLIPSPSVDVIPPPVSGNQHGWLPRSLQSSALLKIEANKIQRQIGLQCKALLLLKTRLQLFFKADDWYNI